MKSLLSNLNSPKVLYITSTHCNVCKVLKPKIKEALITHFPLINFEVVNIEASPEQSAQLQVFTVPTILVYFEGKEIFRYSRHLSVNQFISDLKRPYSLFFK